MRPPTSTPATTRSSAWKEIQCHFIPSKSEGSIAPLILERLAGVQAPELTTDGHRTYPAVARQIQDCVHRVVNHSETFKDPVTGAHTNNVEGEHSVLKRDSRVQFQRLPAVTPSGQIKYLDLVVWRENLRLLNANQPEPAARFPFLAEFCKA